MLNKKKEGKITILNNSIFLIIRKVTGIGSSDPQQCKIHVEFSSRNSDKNYKSGMPK